MTEEIDAKKCFEKWNNYENHNWLVYSLNQLPLFLQHNLDLSDDSQISNLRKAIAIFNQLDEIGFIEDVKKHGDRLVFQFKVEKFPFYGMGNISLANGINGTTISYLIISVLKVFCPYLDRTNFVNSEDEATQKIQIKEILKLINEIKKSKIILSKENSVLFEKQAEEIILDLKN